MSHLKRTPPIKISVNIPQFNNLLDILNSHETSVDNSISESAVRLKEKLLRYSIPFNESEVRKVEIQFFVNEADEIIYHLLLNCNKKEVNTDYYSVLIKIREAKKKSRS